MFDDSKEENAEVWLNIADIMSGMMLVFMGIAVFFMMDILQKKEELEVQHDYVQNIANEYKTLKEELHQDLQEKFKCSIGLDYPEPIIDHNKSLKFAKNLIYSARKSKGFKENSVKVFNKLGSRQKNTTLK